VRFKNAGRGALHAFEPPTADSACKEGQQTFSLVATSRRPAELVHTKLANLPTPGRHDLEPSVRLNRIDAQARGIRQGDTVDVESRIGKIRLKAVVTPDVAPGLVSIDFGWGNPTDHKASMNLLTRDDVWDPVSGGYPNRYTPCEAKKCPDSRCGAVPSLGDGRAMVQSGPEGSFQQDDFLARQTC
jgi:anaerobic selenocysteine-containing dehydrogenase